MERFDSQYKQYQDLIEQALPAYLPRQRDLRYGAVADAMAYSLLSGGKRVRAVLVLAFFRLYYDDVTPALPFAAAMEMVHAYSLIHDDLPCMDDDDLRRGKPSCHIAYGEATALLAGDSLLNRAFETLTSRDATQFFSSKVALRAANILASSSGIHGMIGGQTLDLRGEGKQLTVAELDAINLRKTGALIRAAALMGCCLGGATFVETQAADDYARCVGQAFQIMDDILDETADEKLLGKPIGSDATQHKSTYAAILGVDRCIELVEDLNRQAKDALVKMDLDTEFLTSLADMLATRKF